MISFNAFAKKETPLINKALHKLFDHLENDSLRKASLYALQDGKRTRPLLTLATVFSFCPRSLKKALVPAACLEMIHTYSLIHDDLPCMDDDDYRRGRKSLHCQFPEWLALLAGDFLLTHAFECISSDKKLSCEEKVSLLLCFSSKSGGSGMIAGQIDDLAFQGKKISWHLLQKMHEKKTAFLFMAALEAGALLCHLPMHQKKSLIAFGKKIGLAYQIIDDLADDLEDKGSDQIKEKATAPSILGKKKSKQIAFDLLLAAEDLLLELPKADLLFSFAQQMKKTLKSF